MNRNSTVDALVLSVKPAAGENNRLAAVLSPEKGIFNAMVYGGRKGRLKALVSPYHSGKMWLYTDAVKQSIKITDFNPEHYRIGIRESIYKACAAALCAEIILKTQGAADISSLWILTNGFLDGLNICTEKEAQTGLLRFLWRYIGLMGLQDNSCECRYCASAVPIWYSAAENAFICADCLPENKTVSEHHAALFPLNKDSTVFLQTVNSKSPKEARTLQLSDESISQLRNLLYYLIQNAADTKLKTLDAGKGIL
ncbi:DNA repair protein RecO [Treponema sp. OMZ 840]|uniref:DNA repair protein RecO n=1 Tax=Treponema sp. OMZ 840 TaxID=244313 RepID=UPI003D8B2500